MPLQNSSFARSHGVLLSRLLLPTGLLLVATIAMVAAAFGWTLQVADEDAVSRQRSRLESTLAQHLEATRASFESVLRQRSPAHPHTAERPPPTAPAGPLAFDGIVRVSATFGAESLDGGPLPPSWQEIAPLLLGPAEGLRRERAVEAEPTLDGALLLSNGKHHFEVVRVAEPPRLRDAGHPIASQTTLVGWRRFDDNALVRPGAAHGLHGIRVLSGASAGVDEAIPILDSEGRAVAALTWTAYRPALTLGGQLRPIMLLCILVIAILFTGVALHFHQTTKNLTETEAVSQTLLGRDPLSGLSNRLRFNEQLDRKLEALAPEGEGLAVMFIDLDRFKDVNDSYGHQAGDDLIRSVAERLSALLPEGDTLARLGGDEFAVIQNKITGTQAVEDLTRRILDTLTVPFGIADSQVSIGASIGVALAPEHARDRESLMKLADTALYQAKSEGRNRRTIFQARMDETVRMRKVVADDLKRAIDGDELVLHYQPLFSSDGETIVGLEALIRWPHPQRGMISPAEFIPIAEERGLVIPLGEWVLRRACEDGKRWPSLRVAVNVSPIQFRHRNFVDTVMRVLEETNFEPSRLELELTEGVVVGDADAAEAAMVDLRALGVHLALDDFGTGYSSLIYLRRFAFDKIKIDRSFLESMEATGESAILVHSIVHLGRALGLTVTAEGVETKEQQRFLQALGCHQLQGYLFSKPVPRDEIDRMLRLTSPEARATAA